MPCYGRFYWPLALSGMAILLENQFQNGILARYPDAGLELATFALATSSFQLVNALLVFIPQMVAVMARNPESRRTCLRFAHLAGLLLSCPLLCMGFTDAGADLLADWLNIPAAVLPAVRRYLQWLAPLVWVNGIRHYCTGILVLAERTRSVTLLNGIHLAVLVLILFAGRAAGWAALPTLALATVSSNLVSFALGIGMARGAPILEQHACNDRPVTLGSLLAFFWPLATTSMFFAMSRPVLFAYLNLTSDAVVAIAALRVGFDFCLLFQNPVNQFRHVYATFGAKDPRGVARFMVKVTGLYLGLMALMVYTPLSRLVFVRLLGLEGELLVRSLQTARVMLAFPALIMVRNLYHGQMMVRRRTNGMAVAALLRVGTIALASKLLLLGGWLNHRTGALVFTLGFLAEAAIARQAVRRRTRTDAARSSLEGTA